MADADDVRRLALALPHVTEIDSDGFDFRVADKGFVWSYPERRPGQPRLIRTDVAVLYVGDEAEKQALLLGEPELFFTAPGYDGWALVMLRLAEVDTERLTELVTDAWRMRSPQELAARLDQPGGGPQAGAASRLSDDSDAPSGQHRRLPLLPGRSSHQSQSVQASYCGCVPYRRLCPYRQVYQWAIRRAQKVPFWGTPSTRCPHRGR